jgi:hypothetical protein
MKTIKLFFILFFFTKIDAAETGQRTVIYKTEKPTDITVTIDLLEKLKPLEISNLKISLSDRSDLIGLNRLEVTWDLRFSQIREEYTPYYFLANFIGTKSSYTEVFSLNSIEKFVKQLPKINASKYESNEMTFAVKDRDHVVDAMIAYIESCISIFSLDSMTKEKWKFFFFTDPCFNLIGKEIRLLSRKIEQSPTLRGKILDNPKSQLDLFEICKACKEILMCSYDGKEALTDLEIMNMKIKHIGHIVGPQITPQVDENLKILAAKVQDPNLFKDIPELQPGRFRRFLNYIASFGWRHAGKIAASTIGLTGLALWKYRASKK